MYPPEGLDWAVLMSDPAKGRSYRAFAEKRLADDFELLPVKPGQGTP